MSEINILFQPELEPKIRSAFGLNARDVREIEVGQYVLGHAKIANDPIGRTIITSGNHLRAVPTQTPDGLEGETHVLIASKF